MTDTEFNANMAKTMGVEAARKNYYMYMKFATACRIRLKRFITENPLNTYMIYAVPLVIPGGALFDAKSAINHVIHALVKDGFRASYLGDNLIFITWEKVRKTKYDISDYVSGASRGGQTGSQHRSYHSTEPMIKNGPGPSYRVGEQHRRSSQAMEKEVRARMGQYTEDSTQNSIRRMYSGALTHDQAMSRVARTHATL